VDGGGGIVGYCGLYGGGVYHSPREMPLHVNGGFWSSCNLIGLYAGRLSATISTPKLLKKTTHHAQ